KVARNRDRHPTETIMSDETLPFPGRHERAGGTPADTELFPLTRDAHGDLMLCPPGALAMPVTPVRAFPLSAPDENISLVGRDGVELGWVQRLSDVAPASRALIETALAERACTP